MWFLANDYLINLRAYGDCGLQIAATTHKITARNFNFMKIMKHFQLLQSFYIWEQVIIKAFPICQFLDQIIDGFDCYRREVNIENLQIVSGKFQNSGKFENDAMYDLKQIWSNGVIRNKVWRWYLMTLI